MIDFKFLSNEELAELRNKGSIAVSSHASSLLALICSLGFLLNKIIKTDWKTYFSYRQISEFKTVFAEWTSSILVALVIYLGLVLFFSVIQSRFYFSTARVFSRKEAFFSLSRAFKFLSMASFFRLICMILALSLIVTGWFRLAPQLAIKVLSEDANYSLQMLTAILQKQSMVLGIMLLIVAFLLIVVAKLAFRLDNTRSK